MLEQFKRFVVEESLINPKEDSILLATSGGVDSVVLAHLFAAANYRFAIAHCNFQLRGEESDGDAQFVKQLAAEFDVPYYSTTFSTLAESRATGVSIQMVARTLRYDWLNLLCESDNFAYLATAHHINDSIETSLFNLTKGCGIRGLHGILPKRKQLIRPLLFAHKAMILDYAKEKGIKYREDSSNVSVKYTRNKIRHQVIPPLQEINPNLETTFQGNFQRFREVEYLYEQAIAQLKSNICHQNGEKIEINRELLRQCVTPYSLLYELLNPLGFNQDQINDLIKQPNVEGGGIFSSKTHRLLRTDLNLVVEPIPKGEKKRKNFKIESMRGTWTDSDCDISLSFELIEHTPETQEQIDEGRDSPWVALFNLQEIKQPLYLRRWKEGDTFQPLGMGGKHKKVNKLFKDKKVNRFDREKIWILTDADDRIMWVVGMRVDERFSKWGQYLYKIKVNKL
ncbi:MAG: tRNA lysidine(34) synthetase TilS [Aureispira sp.]|nr:tRNA lysidine(34) synthetase TilS [Aureispira sp.]